ncbi:MAG: hypothetical protein AAB636_02130 [Patescibacteria group bacterium]
MNEKKLERKDILKLKVNLEVQRLDENNSKVQELLEKTRKEQQKILAQKKENENPSEDLLEQRINI